MNAVFHLTSSRAETQSAVLTNVANLLDDETAEMDDVELVCNSGGVTVLLEGTHERDAVETLAERGVTLAACANTIENSGFEKSDLLAPVTVVSSGMGEVVRRQDEGYAYVRP